jgi:hypothetical protein
VYRPTSGSGYTSALMRHTDTFQAMLEAWQSGGVSVECALRQFTDQLVLCAGGDREQSDPGPRHQGPRDQPWYDAECRRLSGELDGAWAAWHASRGGVYFSQDGCPIAWHALVEARQECKRCCKRKKREHEIRVQIDMLGTYFGHTQKDYWHVFFGDRRPQTPLSDVAAWTDYFRVLLGASPQPQSLSEGEGALKQRLYAAAPSSQQEAMAALNADVTQAEVEQCMALPAGKAPDAQGLTGELLRLAAAPAHGAGPGGDPLPECPVVVECTQWLLQAMLSTACVPEVMRTSKLVPVPKSLSPAALAVRDQTGVSLCRLFFPACWIAS